MSSPATAATSNQEQQQLVKIGQISFGPAPVTLPKSQVSNLLPPPSILALKENNDSCWISGEKEAGICWKSDGSIQLTRNGNYKVVSMISSSSSSSTKKKSSSSAKKKSSSPADSTPSAINENELVAHLSSSDDNDSEGDEIEDEAPEVEKLLHAAQKRNAFRQAQYLCAVVGTLILNILFIQDPANRMANAKDFVINFASDIIAVGSVLIITDFLIARDVALVESKDQGLVGFASEFASTLWNGVKEKERKGMIAVRTVVDKLKGKKKRRRLTRGSDDDGVSSEE